MFVSKVLMLESNQWRNPQYNIDPEILPLNCFLFFWGVIGVRNTFVLNIIHDYHELPFTAKIIGDCLLLQLWWHHSQKT